MIEGLCIFYIVQELQINGYNIGKIKKIYVSSKKKPLYSQESAWMEINGDNPQLQLAAVKLQMQIDYSCGSLKYPNLNFSVMTKISCYV